MKNSELRTALKAAYPDRYSFFTWKSLLADFVEMHTQAYYLQRHRYEQERRDNPDALPPTITNEARQAIILLAKQQKHSYLFLAMSHFLLSHESALMQVERDHYRQQAEGYERLTQNYKQLYEQAMVQLEQLKAVLN